MKKIIALLLVLMLCFALCACGEDPEKPADGDRGLSGIPNPVTEVTAEKLRSDSGLNFTAPEGATDVVCNEISGEITIYEMSFTLDLEEFSAGFNVRAAKTDSLDESISGMYYEWEMTGDGALGANKDVPLCSYLCDDGNVGVCYCYKDGFTWAVSMESGADEVSMLNMLKFFAEID